MSKLAPIPIRFDPDVKEALERVAAAEGRSVSGMIRFIVAEWLREHGRLPLPERKVRTA